MRIDLRTHSSVSDGTDSPSELVANALTAGVDVVGLCDHDTFAGLAAAGAAGRQLGVRVLNGIEISTGGTILPAIQFSGLINPVSSLEGGGRLIGEVYPATYMIIISRGIFSKGLSLVDLSGAFWCMLASVPLILGVAILLLKKQER